ncbi:MAG: class I SAM-dependent DNA methyltransferase [Methylococcales bacterium]
MAEQLKTSNSTTLSDFIWKIADVLWGDFQHTDFARVMLPLLLLRRLECVLEPTREAVTAECLKEQDSGMDLNMILPHRSGYSFYNTSDYTLASLGATDTRKNLEDYISQFSDNVSVIFEEFDFANTLIRLDRAKLLSRLVNDFAAIDLHPDVVSERVLSNAYEHLIRKFGISVNDKAGEFMTPSDVVRLVTKLVIHNDADIFTKKARNIYDPACGIAGFLSDAIKQIKELNPQANIVPFGQELNPETHAMAMIAMMIQGCETDNIKQGSTLSNDQLQGSKFHYGLANPPFGFPWEKDQKAVLQERKELGELGRFGAGLPRINDGSMLFLQTLVAKMETPEKGGGRVGIVLSGSPLFNGGAGSGESEIRRWLLEHDYIEAIFSLPNDMFFNTGIGTYIWILSNHKTPERQGKVQLINLSNTWTAMRKSEGSKRRYLSDEQINDIVQDYDRFSESDLCKIFNSTEFGYRRITIERPYRFMFDGDAQSIQQLQDNKSFQSWDDDLQTEVLTVLNNMARACREQHSQIINRDSFRLAFAELVAAKKLKETHWKVIEKCVRKPSETADGCTDKHGKPEADADLRDTENVPLSQNIDDYFQREVLPHVPDAWIDQTKCDELDGKIGIVGYEINFNRYFYQYTPPRALHDIDADLKASEARIAAMLAEIAE